MFGDGCREGTWKNLAPAASKARMLTMVRVVPTGQAMGDRWHAQVWSFRTMGPTIGRLASTPALHSHPGTPPATAPCGPCA